MKNILLVDDDFLALNAFFTLAEWGRYGLSIAREAHNGQEALDYLRENRPDIAFIDVCMPDMDGISLLQQIRKIDPTILCFMLSSYSDYPYVREALKHGAADYLLKHEITSDSILTLLAQHGLDTSKPYNQENAEAKLQRLIAKHHLDSGTLDGYLAFGFLSNERIIIEAQQNSIHQTCRHILNDISGSAVCSPAERELVLLIPGDSSEYAQDIAQARIAKIKKALQKYHHMDYTFTPAKYCADPAQIDHAYQMFHRRQTQVPTETKESSASEESIQLMLAVVNHQTALVEKLVCSIYECAVSRNDVDSFGREMLSIFLRLKQLLGIAGDTIPRLPQDITKWKDFAIRSFIDLASHNAALPPAPASRIIQNALIYLHEHFAEDITLNDVAKYCSVSYNHLSFLFKKETGENIISYLNKLRVFEAARLILYDSLPATTISEKVGFNCYNHFFATFRSITGMAPSEFRKNPKAVEWMVKFSQLFGSWAFSGKPLQDK